MMLSELWDLWGTSLVALVMWREARSEGEMGMRAVGCSIRNRVEHPSWWGNDFASVVTKSLQYSSMTKPGDPQLYRYPLANDVAFAEALEIADALVNHENVSNPVPGADSFFDDSIAPPPWATPECYVGRVGRLRFYNVDHDYELPVTANLPEAPVPLPPQPGPKKPWWKGLFA